MIIVKNIPLFPSVCSEFFVVNDSPLKLKMNHG